MNSLKKKRTAQLNLKKANCGLLFLVLTYGVSFVASSQNGAPFWLVGQAVMFTLTLAISIAICTLPSLSQIIAGKLTSFSELLSRRGAFNSDASIERPKFAVLRILFGGFLLERAFWIAFYLSPTDWADGTTAALTLINLLMSLMVLLGLFTQFAFAFMMVVYWQAGDYLMGTSTLGNDIAAMLSLLMLFANAGSIFSIDQFLMQRSGFMGRIISAFYYQNGVTGAHTLQLAKFMVLSSYWLVCVYSLAMHLSEPAWMSGAAGPMLLTNNFMSRFADEFMWLFTAHPWTIEVARFALWAMLPWYVVVMPFVLLGGIARRYVIIWGVLFFVLSQFVLQLGQLALFEFVLWAGLFWQRSFIANPRKFSLAFDDKCNLCERTVKFLSFVDVFSQLKLRPASQSEAWLESKGLDYQSAMYDLSGIDEAHGDVKYTGYELYMALSRRLLLLLPFYPVLLVGRILLVGPWAYRLIADRRRELFGICDLSSKKINYLGRQAPVKDGDLSSANPIAPASLQILFLSIFFLATIPAPFVGWYGVPFPNAVQPMAIAGQFAAHVYGIAPINVFNSQDLRLAENWFTLASVTDDGVERLLPLLDVDGKRGAMHRSDRIYFGGTLLWRRAAIGTRACNFQNWRDTHVGFVASSTNPASLGSHAEYAYTQYLRENPDFLQFSTGSYVPKPTKVVCKVRFSSSGNIIESVD